MIFRTFHLDGNISHWDSSHGKCDVPSTSSWLLQTYANVSKISNLLHPKQIFFWSSMTPILDRHMMCYITNSIYVWQWRYPVPLRQLWVQREWGEAKGRSLPKCSFLAGLFGHSAPELTSWAQSFWHNGVKLGTVMFSSHKWKASHLLATCRHRHKQTVIKSAWQLVCLGVLRILMTHLLYIVSLKRLSGRWHMESIGPAETIWKWQCYLVSSFRMTQECCLILITRITSLTKF